MFAADLWLVHTVPQAGVVDREEVVQQSVRFGAEGAGFVFPAVTVATSRGPVNVIVMGTVSARLENGTPKTLVVTVSRQATSADPLAAANGGSATKEIPWPVGNDVISFELPAATGAGQDTGAHDRFSIRLRLTTMSWVVTGRGRGGM